MLMGTHGPGPGKVKRVFPDGMPVLNTDPLSKLATKVQLAFDPIITAGQIPFGSFKLSPVTANFAGDLLTLATYLNTLDSDVYLTVWHEPENDMTGPQFVDIYNQCYSTLKPQCPRLKFGPVAMAYQWVPGRAVANPTDWLPTQADFYGVDVYSHTTISQGGRLVDHTGFTRWLSAVDPGKVFVVERGFDVPDADQVNTIKSDMDYLRGIGALGYLVWNVDASGHQYTLGTNALAELTAQVAIEETPPGFTKVDMDAAFIAGYESARAAVLAAVNGLTRPKPPTL